MCLLFNLICLFLNLKYLYKIIFKEKKPKKYSNLNQRSKKWLNLQIIFNLNKTHSFQLNFKRLN